MIKNIDLTAMCGRAWITVERKQRHNASLSRFIDVVGVVCVVTITACWTVIILRALGLIQL